jgi:hypothetical protein
MKELLKRNKERDLYILIIIKTINIQQQKEKL